MEPEVGANDEVGSERYIDQTILVPVDPIVDAFYAGAYQRIQTAIVILAGVGIVPALFFYGWRGGGGFLLGASLAYLNFVWMKQSIIALTNQISALEPAAESSTETASQSRAVVFKFLFRYLAITTVTYVIISSSSISVLSLIAGFFLSVVALLFEAVTEVVYSLRRGS